MKKRLVIGDIHGRGKLVKDFYNLICPDEVIILGDYADSKEYSPEEIKQSWDAIIELRNEHNAKFNNNSFVLLLGNHDLHYLLGGESYTGKNWKTAELMYNEYKRAIDFKELQIAFVDNINKIVYTHAGVTNTWFNDFELETLDDINKCPLDYFRFVWGTSNVSRIGNCVESSPLWVRPWALSTNLYKDKNEHVWKQIVGHTNSEKPWSFGSQMKKCYTLGDKNFTRAKVIVMDCFPNFGLVQELNSKGKITKTYTVPSSMPQVPKVGLESTK